MNMLRSRTNTLKDMIQLWFSFKTINLKTKPDGLKYNGLTKDGTKRIRILTFQGIQQARKITTLIPLRNNKNTFVSKISLFAILIHNKDKVGDHF